MELEPAVEDDWARFPNLPGTHLSLHRAGRQSLELVTQDGSVWASCDGHRFTDAKSVVHAGGRTYRWLQVSKAPKRDLALKAIGAVMYRADDSRDVVDSATNEQALRVTGHHFKRRANTYVTLPDHTTIKLPVRGRTSRNGIMSAVADSGTHLVEYRVNYSRSSRAFAGSRVIRNPFLNPNELVDIAVSPAALSIPAIELLVAVTCECLPSYFDSGGTF
jgi:hypothetical protein